MNLTHPDIRSNPNPSIHRGGALHLIEFPVRRIIRRGHEFYKETVS
ncbi:hypothetical protein ACJIZ3_016066 [Penstemon smallii]|uniref:Uncharacterized protein n=1 Tax=Penstemon smallii TaxID=265156 RepID=A0ABD3RPK7_9LAMI